jgi:hypothetical protein
MVFPLKVKVLSFNRGNTGCGRQIGHSDRLGDSGCQQAAGHLANALTTGVVYFHMFTHGHAFLRDQANALFGECLRRIELRQNLVSPRKTSNPRTTSATHFLNRPIQSGFYRRGARVNVLSIQTQACF